MDEIEIRLSGEIESNRTPSVQYIIFNSDKTIYESRLGFADIRKQRKANKSTRQNVYSVTKTFTALAILLLEEQGKLKIEDPVSEYLRDLMLYPGITIRQLLTHSAGIPNPIPLKWIHLYKDHSSFKSETFFKNVFEKNYKPRSKPNEIFSYSNLGYVILGQLIEKVSGQHYEDFISKKILIPLGVYPEDLSFEIGNTDQYATGYHKRFSFSAIILGFLIDRHVFTGKPENGWIPFIPNYVNGPSYGGLIGTTDSLVKYIREFLYHDSGIISEKIKAKLFSENITNSGQATGMCLAWFKGNLRGCDYFTHAGGGGGYYCEIRIYPEKNIGSVIMFNRTGMIDERFLDKTDVFFV